MCASPLSPRHAQPDWMGGGLVSRQMMHAPPSAAILVSGQRRVSGETEAKARKFGSRSFLERGVLPMAAREMAWQQGA